MSYDSLNSLISVSDNTGSSGITYDGEGTRISNGITTYVTNPNAELSQLLISYNEDGSVTYYVYGLGLISQETFYSEGDIR